MKEEKQLLLDEVKGQMDHYGSFLIMRYASLKATAASEFRDRIAGKGGGVEVVRKRVFLKAAEQAGVTLNSETLQGHIGLVFPGEDLVGTTKEVYAFSKEMGNAIEVVAGQIEGTLYTAQEVERLSKLPSMDGMRAELLGTFSAPMVQTLGVVQSLLTSVLYCLEGKSKEGEAGAGQ